MKLVKYYRILRAINWFQTLRLYCRIKKPKSSSIRVLNKSCVVLHRLSHIIMDEKASLEINRQDYALDKGMCCRIQLAKNAVMHICGNVSFHRNTHINVHENASLIIGGNTFLNGSIIDCSECIRIGSNCAIAEGARIIDNTWHRINYLCANEPGAINNNNSKDSIRPVTIGNNVWIATDVIVLPGVNIGDGAVVASGAVVTKDVPSHCLVAGVPARIVHDTVDWKR